MKTSINQIQLKLESIADPLCGLPSTLNVNNGSVSASEATYYQWSVIGQWRYQSVFRLQNSSGNQCLRYL